MPTKALESLTGELYINDNKYKLGIINGGLITADLAPRFPDVQVDIKGLIREVVFNDPYTIINWKSGTKTIVKAQEGDEFDKEKGLLLAIVKYLNGNGGNYNEIIKEWC